LSVSFRPEDIEEISDEEAEWSDEGDPLYPLDFDVDFGDDFDDPINKDFDFLSDLKPLEFFSIRQGLSGLSVEGLTGPSSEDLPDDDVAEKLERITILNSKSANAEWVETVEQVARLSHIDTSDFEVRFAKSH
jgi:hypothetical protein